MSWRNFSKFWPMFFNFVKILKNRFIKYVCRKIVIKLPSESFASLWYYNYLLELQRNFSTFMIQVRLGVCKICKNFVKLFHKIHNRNLNNLSLLKFCNFMRFQTSAWLNDPPLILGRHREHSYDARRPLWRPNGRKLWALLTSWWLAASFFLTCATNPPSFRFG